MSKHLLCVAIAASVVCAFATTASATQSRLNSLGAGSIAGFSKNITILDDRNIFLLPAELVKYGSWTALEIDGPGHTAFGVHYNLNATTVLAFYGTSQSTTAVNMRGIVAPGVNRASSLSANGGFRPLLGFQDGNGKFVEVDCTTVETCGDDRPPMFPETTEIDEDGKEVTTPAEGQADPVHGPPGLTHKGTIILGLDLGATRLGFLLGVQADSRQEFDAEGDLQFNQGPLVIDFGVGAGFAVGNGALDMGLNIRYGMTTDEVDKKTASNNSQFDINILARGTFGFHGNHKLVPYVNFLIQSGNGQLTDDDDDSRDEALNFAMALGTDIRLNLADGIFVQPGFGLAFQNYKHTRTTTKTTLTSNEVLLLTPYYNVAVEVLCWEWMSLRFGGGQSVIFHSFTEEDLNGSTGKDEKNSEVEHHIATGVGFHLPHNVNIDIQVATGWWKQGPYLLTGNNGTFGMNAAISKDW